MGQYLVDKDFVLEEQGWGLEEVQWVLFERLHLAQDKEADERELCQFVDRVEHHLEGAVKGLLVGDRVEHQLENMMECPLEDRVVLLLKCMVEHFQVDML